MKCPVVDGTVAEERDRDSVRIQELEAVCGPGRLEDARADDPARPHHADLRGEQVHAPAPSARAAGLSTEQLGEESAGRDPLGKGVAVAAVGAEHDIIGLEVGADARGDGLFTDVRVAGAVDQAALVGTGEVLLAAADRLHLSVEREERGSVANLGPWGQSLHQFVASDRPIGQNWSHALSTGSCFSKKTSAAIPM